MSDAEMPDPDQVDARVAHFRKQARRALDSAGVKVGGEHLIDPIAAALQRECTSMRDMFASVVTTLQGVQLEGDPLESVLMSIRLGYLDHQGNVQMLLPGDE